MARHYTTILTEQELDDILDALPDSRPIARTAGQVKTPSQITRETRQWNLRANLERKRRLGPDTVGLPKEASDDSE